MTERIMADVQRSNNEVAALNAYLQVGLPTLSMLSQRPMRDLPRQAVHITNMQLVDRIEMQSGLRIMHVQ